MEAPEEMHPNKNILFFFFFPSSQGSYCSFKLIIYVGLLKWSQLIQNSSVFSYTICWVVSPNRVGWWSKNKHFISSTAYKWPKLKKQGGRKSFHEWFSFLPTKSNMPLLVCKLFLWHPAYSMPFRCSLRTKIKPCQQSMQHLSCVSQTQGPAALQALLPICNQHSAFDQTSPWKTPTLLSGAMKFHLLIQSKISKLTSRTCHTLCREFIYLPKSSPLLI